MDRPHGALEDSPAVTLTLSRWLVQVCEGNDFVVMCREGLGESQ